MRIPKPLYALMSRVLGYNDFIQRNTTGSQCLPPLVLSAKMLSLLTLNQMGGGVSSYILKSELIGRNSALNHLLSNYILTSLAGNLKTAGCRVNSCARHQASGDNLSFKSHIYRTGFYTCSDPCISSSLSRNSSARTILISRILRPFSNAHSSNRKTVSSLGSNSSRIYSSQ